PQLTVLSVLKYDRLALRELHKKNTACRILPKFSNKRNVLELLSVALLPVRVYNLHRVVSIKMAVRGFRNTDLHSEFPFPNPVCTVRKDNPSQTLFPLRLFLWLLQHPEWY